MSICAPHYLLYSGAGGGYSAGARRPGRWHFALETTDGKPILEADAEEPDAHGERLELLSVVRGLEALDQPSRVTLVTPSGYVRNGFRYGLDEWRNNRWRWEHFGRLVPIKNEDLWKRVDQAMQYHQVECRLLRLDGAHCGLNNVRPLGITGQLTHGLRRALRFRPLVIAGPVWVWRWLMKHLFSASSVGYVRRLTSAVWREMAWR
jgi:ribonuclease HI